MAFHRQHADITCSPDGFMPGGETVPGKNPEDVGGLTDSDLRKFEALLAKTHGADQSSYWPMTLSIIGATVTIVGTLASLIIFMAGKEAEVHAAMHIPIEDSLKKNTAAISALTNDFHILDVNFAELNGTMKHFNQSVEGVLATYKGSLESLGKGVIPTEND